jgi:hypothetical protein
LVLFFEQGKKVDCYPYLERVEVLRSEALKKLKTDPKGALKEFDASLKVLNERVKSSKTLLLDCGYCLCGRGF